MVFLLPASPAHAATATVTLSTLSSGVKTAVTSTTVGTSLVITGSGFAPAKAVTITTAVGTLTVAWLTTGTCTTTNGGTGAATKSTDSLVIGGCLTTSAEGDFQTIIAVPNLPGGAVSVSVSDGTTTVAAALTITPKVAVTYTGNNFGFPEEAISPSIAVTGFGSGESVTITTTVWTTTSFTCSTGSGIGTFGTCTSAAGTSVADTTGGAKTITATGATSGLTATTTYTVNPWAAFYNSASGTTTFSFLGSAPTSIIVEAHGLPAGTIAANSITLGGVGTSHSSVTIGSSGGFGGVGGQLVVAPTAQVPFGSISAVIDGTTFNWASGNIASGVGTWGYPLISSIVGSLSSTGVVTTSQAAYMPGTGFTASTTSNAPAQNLVAFIGYGFYTAGGTAAITIGNGGSGLGAVTFHGAACVATCDANGAVFATSVLGDTPWSTVAAPATAASYTATTAQGTPGTNGPANILSPSFGITAWVQKASPSTVDYTTTNEVLTAHGFSNVETVTFTIGGASFVVGGTCTTAANGMCATSGTQQVPDISGGKQNVVATGSLSGVVVTNTGGITFDPIVNFASGQTLSINTGGAGQQTTIRTGVGYGVHGLAANTAYNVVWNALSGSQTVGTFTSSATGSIPVPGVQFTIPGDTAGIHILDLQTASGATALFGGTVLTEVAPNQGFFTGVDTTAFGDMLFNNIGLLSAAPSVATIGLPESLSGNGLAAGGSYVVALGSGAGTVSTAAPALATFTATSTGAIPAGVALTLGDTPTGVETGTVEYFSVQTAAHFGVSGTSDAYAQFVLAASASDNVTAEPAGHAVTLSAHALNVHGVYDVVFNYVQSPITSTSYTGTVVGVVAPNSVGAGSVTWNIPSTAAPGTYTVQLVVATAGVIAPVGAVAGTAILNTPLTITVGGTSGSCTNEGTSCMALTGTPSVTTQGSNKLINAVFTNNSNAPQTAFLYAVVHNALGQTVYYTTATVSPAAGGSATGQLVLFGLAPGTYSATVFAVSTSGTALSTTSTVTVTV